MFEWRDFKRMVSKNIIESLTGGYNYYNNINTLTREVCVVAPFKEFKTNYVSVLFL